MQAHGNKEVIRMTPVQCNEVLEDKLGHLQPLMESALRSFQRVDTILSNGAINWRKVFKRAKEKL